ncbi:MAG: homoserine kinase [Tissierellia bacterium]|nr:homoserine kinase [Tissierellia bacterium]
MKIQVPGTTANLGPGFDALGLALTCYSYLEVKPAGEKEAFSKKNLIYKSFDYFFQSFDEPTPNVIMELRGDIPSSRGLGSSAACIVGGLTVANLISGKGLSKENLLEMATKIEGHPDNVAPCIYGGLISSTEEQGRILTASFEVHPDWKFYTAIPDFELSTQDARKVLPKKISFKDGVFNISRIPLLLKALEIGDLELLRAGTVDALVQPYRGSLIDGYEKIKGFGQKYGAATISGAGPTILIITKEDLDMDEWNNFTVDFNHSWELKRYEVDREGTKLI